VDAADYVVWRKNGGSEAQFNAWRAHFGQVVGGGSSANSSVPEPATVMMFWIGLLAMINSRRRTVSLR
jgi:hypothetical protein